MAVALGLLAGLAGPARAVEIRDYVPARHDRFIGFPTTPSWNDSAWYGSRSFSGVGWVPSDPDHKRQVALVSPLHAVCATHYPPPVGTTIRFLNLDGVTVDRTVAVLTPIKNDLDQNSDLTLMTLSAPLAAGDKVVPLPYLNLADPAGYIGLSLTAFGWHAKAGSGTIAGFGDLEETFVNKTRVMTFEYQKLAGNQDDCYLEIGDSGSPTFGTANGTPALLGTHTAVDDNTDPVKRTSFDTFVPYYIDGLNAAMASSGYQMIPAYPLEASNTTTPAVWRKANPGTCRIDIRNASTADVTTLSVTLRFPASAVPDSLTASGWSITPGSTGVYQLARASLPAGVTSSITAEWLDLGTGDSLNVGMDLAADANPQRTFTFNHALAPSYNAWAAGLSNKDPAADPDADGISNILEYAFGGDPTVAARTTTFGAPLAPVMGVSGATATLVFPVRDDADLRGLSYLLEFSSSLAAGSWSVTPPSGFTQTDAPFDPAVTGFVRRTITFDANQARQFCRVRVELNE